MHEAFRQVFRDLGDTGAAVAVTDRMPEVIGRPRRTGDSRAGIAPKIAAQ
ncbi:hypothetical protein [Streptomyces kurssanovii]|uniref:Transposase n=1 Tax=Streptomyces kurssanovii TaxID=67312 RepID=A0ABV3HU61_9ACTN